MGKIQCTSSNIKNKNQTINKVNNEYYNHHSFHKDVIDEYKFLNNQIGKNPHSKKSQLYLYKKISRFMKWYYMAYSQDIEIEIALKQIKSTNEKTCAEKLEVRGKDEMEIINDFDMKVDSPTNTECIDDLSKFKKNFIEGGYSPSFVKPINTPHTNPHKFSDRYFRELLDNKINNDKKLVLTSMIKSKQLNFISPITPREKIYHMEMSDNFQLEENCKEEGKKQNQVFIYEIDNGRTIKKEDIYLENSYKNQIKLENNISIDDTKKINESIFKNLNEINPGKSQGEEEFRKIVESNLRNFYKNNCTKFKLRVTKGPPKCFRWLSWIIISNLPMERNENAYNYSYLINIDNEVDNQIKKDLPRTSFKAFNNNFIPEKQEFSQYKILKAFASNDKEVSYCQGMNFIVKFLLQISNNHELESYYMLLSMFSNTFNNDEVLRGFYTQGFPLLKYYIKIFYYYLEKRSPNLHKHLKKLQIPDEAWISKWYQTLFTIILPSHIVERVWDCLFSNGMIFLTNITIALIERFQNTLIKIDDSFEFIEFFTKLSLDETYEINSKIGYNLQNSNIKLDFEELLENAIKIKILQSDVEKIKSNFNKVSQIDLNGLTIKYDLHNNMESIHIPSRDKTISLEKNYKSSSIANFYKNEDKTKRSTLDVNISIFHPDFDEDIESISNESEGERIDEKIKIYGITSKMNFK